MGEYRNSAREDAKEMAMHFIEQIVEQLIEDGEASSDYNNDYQNGDSYHHEKHVDKDYELLEAAQLLDELDEYKETDYGLWEGLTPRRAIAAQAAYTYGNAVGSEWDSIIEDINNGYDLFKSDDNYEEQDEPTKIKWTQEYVEEKIKEW